MQLLNNLTTWWRLWMKMSMKVVLWHARLKYIYVIVSGNSGHFDLSDEWESCSFHHLRSSSLPGWDARVCVCPCVHLRSSSLPGCLSCLHSLRLKPCRFPMSWTRIPSFIELAFILVVRSVMFVEGIYPSCTHRSTVVLHWNHGFATHDSWDFQKWFSTPFVLRMRYCAA